MRNVDIEIFPIARTQIDRQAVRRWLDHLGATGYEVPEGENVTDPALLIALAAKRCYNSFEPGLNPNVTKVRADLTLYLDNILKSGHGSVLEHSTWSFAIEGVSRVFTGEMNRHRAGVAVSEASMRFIRYTDIPSWLPTSLRLTKDESAALDDIESYLGDPPHEPCPSMAQKLDLATKKLDSQACFARVYAKVEEEYAKLQAIWADELAPNSAFANKKHVTSMMRRIVPMGVATGGVWTLNFRALRHVIAMRASEAAEEEILHVFTRIAKIMIQGEPMLYTDFEENDQGYMVPKYKKV